MPEETALAPVDLDQGYLEDPLGTWRELRVLGWSEERLAEFHASGLVIDDREPWRPRDLGALEWLIGKIRSLEDRRGRVAEQAARLRGQLTSSIDYLTGILESPETAELLGSLLPKRPAGTYIRKSIDTLEGRVTLHKSSARLQIDDRDAALLYVAEHAPDEVRDKSIRATLTQQLWGDLAMEYVGWSTQGQREGDKGTAVKVDLMLDGCKEWLLGQVTPATTPEGEVYAHICPPGCRWSEERDDVVLEKRKEIER